MTRGFITLATGQEMYYMLARNLLYSYKLYTDNPLPFAIMCDRENEYTALFDDVIILQNPKCGYFDKFELLINAPYDETIFIDADCLAYSDLNAYWDYFCHADDFSASGYDFPIDSQDGLFWEDSIGEYKGKVHWKPAIHGGLYYIRRGPVCDAIYAEYLNIMQHYHEYRWPDYCIDEPVFGLAMAAHDCHATDAVLGNYVYPWETQSLKCDILSGKCTYTTTQGAFVNQGRMIHWSVYYCKMPTYKLEAEKVNLMVKRGIRPGQSLNALTLIEKILYQYGLRRMLLELEFFMFRVVRYIKRLKNRVLQSGVSNQ